MNFLIRYLVLGFCIFAIYSCASSECIRKPRKTKQYRVSKMKSYQRGVGGGSASTVDGMDELETRRREEALRKKEEEAQRALEPEEEMISIADSKIGAPPKEEEVIEFRGQEIDLTEEDFMYEEEILFISQTNLFSDPKKARGQLKDLARLLKKNDNIFVTIQGNTANNEPVEGVLYGASEEVLNQEITFNSNDNATIRDSMLGRAKKVYNALIETGVDPDQLEFTTGSHRQYRHERVVSFIIKQKN